MGWSRRHRLTKRLRSTCLGAYIGLEVSRVRVVGSGVVPGVCVQVIEKSARFVAVIHHPCRILV
jgi:hypothetical protein